MPPQPPTWHPTQSCLKDSNPARLMRDLGHDTFESLHRWSITNRADYWQEMLRRLNIRFITPPTTVLEERPTPEETRWLPGARFNIIDSLLNTSDPNATAIIDHTPGTTPEPWSHARLTNEIANTAAQLRPLGITKGTVVGLIAPMHARSITAYLAVIALGGTVAAVPESLSAPEIDTRFRIAGVTAIIAQHSMPRGNKHIPLYDRLRAIPDCPPIILLPGDTPSRDTDTALSPPPPKPAPAKLNTTPRSPDDPIAIIFSSGTTAEPKAIPWTMATPIKAAADAFAHHDVRPGDTFAWPTSLGWMMGPWLIYATLLNRATIAVSEAVPTSPDFARFIDDANVTHLGLVPTIVRAWRANNTPLDHDWSRLRLFSSTGEVSNAEDMAWLMQQPRGEHDLTPIIEYCGGTEIGGGYITGSVTQPQRPGRFSTPALGTDLRILGTDDQGNNQEADRGELYIAGPSIGLSQRLLNKDRDHHAEYHDGAPKDPRGQTTHLRRHGDELERIGPAEYRAHGRCDDAMNLGGIKVSAAELERAAAQANNVKEVACIAVAPSSASAGPAELVAVVVPVSPDADPAALQAEIQHHITNTLSPLYKLARVELRDVLPRTPSNKVMRRVLRHQLESAHTP